MGVEFGQLFEYIVLTLLRINFSHKLWVARSEVENLAVSLIDIPCALFDHLANYILVNLSHLLEQIQGLVAAHDIVLEDVIHLGNLVVDKFIDHARAAERPLSPNTQTIQDSIVFEV